MVTDKPMKDWPSSRKQSTSKTTTKGSTSCAEKNSVISIPNRLEQSQNRQSTVTNCSTPTNNKSNEIKDTNKIDLMALTRGKYLATNFLMATTKTPQSTSLTKTKDVLETAVKLNMKILTHRSILDFCKKYIKISLDDLAGEQTNNETDCSQTNSNSKLKVKQLKSPFLKFEDKDEKFAPIYKEFDVWPSICIDSNSSSIVTTNTNQNHFNNQPVQQQTNTPTVPKINAKLIQPPINKKRQRVLFCEICSKEFTNMIEVKT